MTDYIIPISIIVIIIGLAIFYIIKSKKNGKKCIGCPDGKTCQYKKVNNNQCCCSKEFYKIDL